MVKYHTLIKIELTTERGSGYYLTFTFTYIKEIQS
jgi:hypothetical protein